MLSIRRPDVFFRSMALYWLEKPLSLRLAITKRILKNGMFEAIGETPRACIRSEIGFGSSGAVVRNVLHGTQGDTSTDLRRLFRLSCL